LPAAIAAPTPVSSLVHSSTLVTAGVYLVIRFYYVLTSYLSYRFFVLGFILTSLLAGLIACVEPDFKRVVAMSTLRQLGLIIYVLCLGELRFCFYHIVCHALFKSLLFLSCGLIILIRFGSQDSRFMGSYSLRNSLLSIIFIVSRMRLFGFPFLSGFFSKDRILEGVLLSGEYFYLYFLFFFVVF